MTLTLEKSFSEIEDLRIDRLIYWFGRAVVHAEKRKKQDERRGRR